VDLFEDAVGELEEVMGHYERQGEPFTVDQQLKILEVKALLSISQELSRIRRSGVNPEHDSGH
jgi:hypothetical protein